MENSSRTTPEANPDHNNQLSDTDPEISHIISEELLREFWTGEYIELVHHWSLFIQSEESPEEVDRYLDRIHLRAYDEYARWEIRQRLLDVSGVTHKDASSCCNADADMIHDCFVMVAQSQYQQTVAKQLEDSKELRRAWRQIIEEETIEVDSDIMAEYWPITPWEEHKLTAEQRETYYDVIRSWSYFNVYFLGKNPLDRNAVPNYGCLDILREFSEMPTLEIIPGYERGALKELFQKIDNGVDLSAREIWHLVNRVFIKLGTGLYLACKENLVCELACEEKMPCEADRTFAKATDWRHNMLGVMSRNQFVKQNWPLVQYLMYVGGDKEPLERFWETTRFWELEQPDSSPSMAEEQSESNYSVTEEQWESDM